MGVGKNKEIIMEHMQHEKQKGRRGSLLDGVGRRGSRREKRMGEGWERITSENKSIHKNVTMTILCATFKN